MAKQERDAAGLSGAVRSSRIDWFNVYSGLEFKNRGRDHFGVDCWGLIRLVMLEQAGIELPLYDTISAYEGETVEAATAGEIERGEWRRVTERDALPFDVVQMAGAVRDADGLRRGNVHAGIMIQPEWLIHIEKGCNALCQQLSQPAIARRITAFYRHRALDGQA